MSMQSRFAIVGRRRTDRQKDEDDDCSKRDGECHSGVVSHRDAFAEVNACSKLHQSTRSVRSLILKSIGEAQLRTPPL